MSAFDSVRALCCEGQRPLSGSTRQQPVRDHRYRLKQGDGWVCVMMKLMQELLEFRSGWVLYQHSIRLLRPSLLFIHSGSHARWFLANRQGRASEEEEQCDKPHKGLLSQWHCSCDYRGRDFAQEVRLRYRSCLGHSCFRNECLGRRVVCTLGMCLALVWSRPRLQAKALQGNQNQGNNQMIGISSATQNSTWGFFKWVLNGERLAFLARVDKLARSNGTADNDFGRCPRLRWRAGGKSPLEIPERTP
jgi:hypothetical protein